MTKGFCYAQTTGELLVVNGDYALPLAVGYAGHPPYVNDPDAEHRPNLGPIPRGIYVMRLVEHPRFAAPAIHLIPVEDDIYGRSGFFIHGDNSGGNQTASEGCIILDRATRQTVRALLRLGYDQLQVVV